MKDEDRFAAICAAEITALSAAFFHAKSEDVLFVKERAKDHAERELRMVIWEFVRELMR
jgi:hypothetical protein